MSFLNTYVTKVSLKVWYSAVGEIVSLCPPLHVSCTSGRGNNTSPTSTSTSTSTPCVGSSTSVEVVDVRKPGRCYRRICQNVVCFCYDVIPTGNILLTICCLYTPCARLLQLHYLLGWKLHPNCTRGSATYQ